ncbi:MAG TPA: HAMP domain-containing sensor histidine kinase [Stellaceae bacterium]|nr:HAMP domain-containing sensor histidine kinase [Stellaceae bacterium]
MRNLIRTNAFRLAALYFLLFAASVSTLLAFVYFSTAGFVEKQTEATIDAEITGLNEQYEPTDIESFLNIIRSRSATKHSGATVYLITDALLRPLAGNLSGWPRDSQTVRPGWINFPLEVHGQNGARTDTVLAKVFVLPGGYRMLVGRDLQDARAFRARINQTLAWSGLLTMALGVVGGFLMTRNMLLRVDAVNRTSARIMNGDLGQRVPLSGTGDEFDQLANNLNAMLDRIERLMTGMQQVTDNIAHDLRTPLARLRARLEVTLLERPDAAVYGEAIRQTIAEADRLLGTFNALLNIAEAEAGSRRDTLAPVDLAEIVRSVAELYEPVADDKGLTLTVESDDAIAVRGDRHLLSQAVANLLDNALKYTPEGAVTVAARQRGESARVEVADSGPGVPSDRREAVFDRFVRLEGSRSTPGNGLGLSLVRAVARLHGGEVWLEDNKPGLKAVLTLPANDMRNSTSARLSA